MASDLNDLCNKLAYIKDYLTKLGPSRRSLSIRIAKRNEAENLYAQFSSLQKLIDIDIQENKLEEKDISCINNLITNIDKYYAKIIVLCSESTEVTETEKKASTMEKFELKTAIALLPIMTDDENVTKSLISNIEMYDSMIDDSSKKQLINFILKSRLSESAKLRMCADYSSVSDLIRDMRTILLPKKSDTAIQSKLYHARQNDKSVEDFGKELEQLFVDLTITQANGDSNAYKTLKPINERIAIKRFSDGLRNSRLSTIIAARNYNNLKDAIQGALDEKVSSAAEERVMNFHHNRGKFRGNYRRGYRMNYNATSGRGNSNNNNNHRSSGYNVNSNRSSGFNRSFRYRGRGGFRGHTASRRPPRQQINTVQSNDRTNSEVVTETENVNLFFRA